MTSQFERMSLYMLCLILMTICVLLSLQNRDLKKTLGTVTAWGKTEPLKRGDHVGVFRVNYLDGTQGEFSHLDPSKKYLLFVFSTTCPHCEKTLPYWESITKSRHDNCNIIGVSVHDLQATRNFITDKRVGFYTVSSYGDSTFDRNYKISGVPETILLEGNGTVDKAWVGELNDDLASEINELINGDRSPATN